MKKIVLMILISLSFISITNSQTKRSKEKIIYKYKKYQKFDFEDLVIEGETGSPGDLSLGLRYERKFKNRLPYRKNFNAEIRKGLERIR